MGYGKSAKTNWPSLIVDLSLDARLAARLVPLDVHSYRAGSPRMEMFDHVLRFLGQRAEIVRGDVGNIQVVAGDR